MMSLSRNKRLKKTNNTTVFVSPSPFHLAEKNDINPSLTIGQNRSSS